MNSNGSKKKLEYDDVFCVACRCIYTRPVTMPCKHTLCLECFKKMVDITSYQCPMCRRRISNWLRKYKHDWDSMVNEEFWEEVQQQFPVEVQKKLNDEDDGIDVIFGKSVSRIEIKEGEIKKEFDVMMINSALEKEKIELQSLEVAKKLQEEEDESFRKTQNLLNEKIILEDAKLASILQENVKQNLQEEEILSNELDKRFAKQEQSKLPKRGPLDIYTKVSEVLKEEYKSVENDVPCCSKSSYSSSLSSSPNNSFLKSSINSSATGTREELKDDILDACSCGRLLDMNSNRPPCQFCIDQITILDKFTTQQNDYLMAKNLEDSWRKQNFEEYNLRKRTNTDNRARGPKKVMKLSKGQLTLKQLYKKN